MKQTKAEKAVDKLINDAYLATCKNIQVNMMDIPSIFKVGREAWSEGVDEDELKVRIRAFVETIRKN